MAKTCLLLCLFVLICRPLFSQESDSYGIYGYTSIDYDQDSNTVTAYSETDIDINLQPYYEANLCLYVLDDQGNLQTPVFCPTTFGGSESRSGICQYQGSSGVAYTAYGGHSASMIEYTYDEFHGGFLYYDTYGFSDFASQDITEYGGIDFFAPGNFLESNSSFAELGSTYDSATLVVPLACAEVRDVLIREYVTEHSPFRPSCVDFTYGPFWHLYLGYYTNLELTPDQSTAYPNFAVLQKYALVDGLDAVSDNAYPGSTSHFEITSGYRNPAAERVAAAQNDVKAVMNSRHLAGDGVDLRTLDNVAYWQAIHDACITPGACVEPINVQGNYRHAHLDWRTKTGVSNSPSGGNSFPYYHQSCPAGWGN